MPVIPTVIESSPRGERSMDIYSRLLRDRIIWLGTPVVDETANIIMAELLFLESEDSEKPISMYINSPGGSISAGLAILDTMGYIQAPVNTFCMGLAASMGALLLACGEKRYSLPNSRIMIHQPSGGFEGQETDIAIVAAEMLRTRKRVDEILSRQTGKPVEVINRDTDRDYFMTAQEALDYGLIDEIIQRRPA